MTKTLSDDQDYYDNHHVMSIDFTGSSNQVSIDSEQYHINESVKVCAKVEGSFMFKPPKQTTYLNLGTSYPNHKLTVVIFENSLIHFPYVPADHYKGLDVCVTGIVKKFKELFEIIIDRPEEILIVE